MATRRYAALRRLAPGCLFLPSTVLTVSGSRGHWRNFGFRNAKFGFNINSNPQFETLSRLSAAERLPRNANLIFNLTIYKRDSRTIRRQLQTEMEMVSLTWVYSPPMLRCQEFFLAANKTHRARRGDELRFVDVVARLFLHHHALNVIDSF